VAGRPGGVKKLMIRKFSGPDMDAVLNIWLEASIEAHSFIDREFWGSNIDDMRNVYLPASDTYVYEEDGAVKGFLSLADNTVAALFVSPEFQGRGVGRELLDEARGIRKSLELCVYKKNIKAFDFYKRYGFNVVEERVDERSGEIEVLMRMG